MAWTPRRSKSCATGAVNGPALCRMFNRVIAGALTLPQQLSSDHDPLFKFYRWKANLRILDVTEVKTVPHVPLSHVSSQELSDFENLESWTASGGISLPNCRVPTTAIRLGAVVYGIVTLV